MAHAGSLMTAGDTLYLRAGTYTTEVIESTLPTGTSDSARVTLAGYPSDAIPVIRPTNAGGRTMTLEGSNTRAYLTFQRLIFDGVNQNSDSNSDGIYVHPNHHHLRFQDVEVKNIWRNGILFAGSNSEFLTVSIHDVSLGCAPIGGCYPIYLTGDSNLFDHLDIYNFPAYGVHLYNSISPFPSNNTIRNSLIHHGTGAQNNGQAALLLASGTNNLAYNNIVYNNTQLHGIRVNNNASNVKVYNNTIYGNQYNGITLGDSGAATNTDVKNNLMYGNGTDAVNQGGAATGTTYGTNLCSGSGTGCAVIGTPSFVNAGAANFHLQSGSLGIDQGTTLAAVPTDYDGATRVPPYDIGAYEFGAVSSTATHVVVTVQPSTVAVNAVMASWTVEAWDASNVRDTAYNGAVSIAIGTNPGGGTLTGTVSGSFTAGVGTWCCNNTITQPGVGYTIVVTAPGLTGVTTNAFTVTGGSAPTNLRVLR
jgi:hypothetical protein